MINAVLREPTALVIALVTVQCAAALVLNHPLGELLGSLRSIF
ncbi:MAG: hypothetical protein QOJ39_3428 [Candidatus Eremiobacteraeota bacterium]|jgi:hypothetical protein|nr:hypothetical protein [Candidatus Eremiobacteraeota bacterium]MEA2721564.1 hypothetical protein [Candidatus Eremiobacteraeota bacterium]